MVVPESSASASEAKFLGPRLKKLEWGNKGEISGHSRIQSWPLRREIHPKTCDVPFIMGGTIFEEIAVQGEMVRQRPLDRAITKNLWETETVGVVCASSSPDGPHILVDFEAIKRSVYSSDSLPSVPIRESRVNRLAVEAKEPQNSRAVLGSPASQFKPRARPFPLPPLALGFT
ncbi:hypothetical protein SISSUDRAFT_1035517 [Sistotremastrum suecicum HHB10207 ss-3]|uniref:Uncharacterized protein n=1 Tax=Sistotremastrum suecicum HHB10207 ss-3 TaxID=1314776 RepID=A0A166AN94_9AGAM|nr:hypothetical protein SISSUDRAFT_1035517 [Sistotremastrum suecicum HHB10207 ss-3]